MKTYEIYDARCSTLLSDDPVYTAETGRKALDMHLKAIGFNGKVKVSGANEVHFKVSPVAIVDGRKYLDFRGGKRCVWYQIQPNG